MLLKIGTKAPAFNGINQNEENVALKDFLGKKVVLYFYPKDDTPGCTAQACNLKDNYSLLKNKGIEVIGISADTVKKHKKFEQKFALPFSLIADVERKIIDLYKVWGEKQMMGKTFMGIHRVTFLINELGKIEHIINKVITKNHTAQIEALWKL